VLTTINTLRKRGLGRRAYVLTGKSGTGKTTIGRLIASEVAGPLATQEENAKDVTFSYIRQMEAEFGCRALASDEGGRRGRRGFSTRFMRSRMPCVNRGLKRSIFAGWERDVGVGRAK